MHDVCRRRNRRRRQARGSEWGRGGRVGRGERKLKKGRGFEKNSHVDETQSHSLLLLSPPTLLLSACPPPLLSSLFSHSSNLRGDREKRAEERRRRDTQRASVLSLFHPTHASRPTHAPLSPPPPHRLCAEGGRRSLFSKVRLRFRSRAPDPEAELPFFSYRVSSKERSPRHGRRLGRCRPGASPFRTLRQAERLRARRT